MACRNSGDSRITAIDFSRAAIRIANERASELRSETRFLVADAQSLTFKDNSFDCVITCECMDTCPAPRRMARELFRVLKPGGKFCLTTENYLNGMLLAWLHCWATNRPFNSGSGIQPIEKFFVYFQVQRYLQEAGLFVDRSTSSHYQWLLCRGLIQAAFARQT